MGKAPQPAALKLLGGRSPGRDSGGRPVPDVPRFERGAPQPPSLLSPVARELWEATAPTLEALNLIKPEDGPIFTAYCESWATYREALSRVRAEGLTVFNPKTGMPHKNPALNALEQAGIQLLRYGQQFGLTPSAELSLAASATPESDDDDDPFAFGASS
jgi:P27 family predicted phage terminase small subunit